jgi:hypothetical protein
MAPFLKDSGVEAINRSQLCEKFHNDFCVIGRMSRSPAIQRHTYK